MPVMITHFHCVSPDKLMAHQAADSDKTFLVSESTTSNAPLHMDGMAVVKPSCEA
jgi:hypothetical protein